MCGRFEIDTDNSEMNYIVKKFNEIASHPTFTTGEVRPTDTVPFLCSGQKNPTIADLGTWGYRRSFAKGPLINARSESAPASALFKDDFNFRRCLIPATGFYEWSAEKRKFLFKLASGKCLFIAGLYSRSDNRKEVIILTKAATYPVSEVHERIPVLIERAKMNDWLGDKSFAHWIVSQDYKEELRS